MKHHCTGAGPTVATERIQRQREEQTMTNYITTTICTEHGLATLIKVFTVEPENQQQLVDLLVEATTSVIQHQRGFISANIHASLDGTRVANYAQWRSRQDLENMLADPTASEHVQVIAVHGLEELASLSPRCRDGCTLMW